MCSTFVCSSCSLRSRSRSLWFNCSRRVSFGMLEDDLFGGSSNGFASRECVEAKGFWVSSAGTMGEYGLEDGYKERLTHDGYKTSREYEVRGHCWAFSPVRNLGGNCGAIAAGHVRTTRPRHSRHTDRIRTKIDPLLRTDRRLWVSFAFIVLF